MLAAGMLLSGSAAGGDAVVLSLADAKRIALANNRAVESSRQEKEAASGRITASRSRALPSLTATGSFFHQGTVPTADFDGTTVEFGAADRYTVAATLNQALYKGGRVGAGLRIARLYEQTAFADEQVSLQNASYEAVSGYQDVLLALELHAVSEKTYELASKHYEDLEKKSARGLVSRYDVLRARVEEANAEAGMIAMDNAVKLLTAALLKTLGMPLEQEVMLSDSLEYAAVETDLDAAMAAALAGRPEIARQELVVAMREENMRAIAGEMKPSIGLVGTWEGGTSTRFSFGGDEWADGWEAGIEVTVPLFDGLRTRGKYREERARLRQEELALEELRETVKLEVKQAVLRIEDAGKAAMSQEENVARAEEGLRLAGVRYDGGEATELEVMDAREALAQAGSNYSRAVYGHMRAKLDLERAAGTLAAGPPGSDER